MSSINTTIKLSKYNLNTRFIKSIKAARALVNPKGNTKNSLDLYLVQKGNLGMSLAFIFNWCYLDIKSIFERTLSPFNWSNKSSILGKGYLFLTITLLSSQ